jgi:hypothetical protein
MKNIHVLPTEKPSRLMIDTIENKLYLQPILHEKTINVLTQNIYITSSEEIKEGDWFYFDDAEIIAKYIDLKPVEEAKKIVLTTNQDLVKDGVQAIDDEFLEWFVKNSSCERVEVDTYVHSTENASTILYGAIIPKEIGFKMEDGKRTETFYSKEEPTIEEEYTSQDFLNEVCWNNSKQETLEEAATNYTIDFATKSAFKLGAKWQQEQDKNKYSDSDMTNYALYILHNDVITPKEWFEHFKNK